jgi:murein DD-endopeptidase MepM/ murein hydrolase activator NlpD
MTTKELTRRTVALLLTVLVAGAVAAAATASSRTPKSFPLHIVSTFNSTRARTWTYDWPLKPFDRQHPVRGFLDDPRIGDHGSEAFHFGIDIAAPDGTAVYAVEAGTVYFDSPMAIAVVSPDRSHAFGYWHVVPVVRSHQFVHRHQLLGHIGKSWGHVHFAEHRNGEYLNPLRPGGIGPYTDATVPTVHNVWAEHGALIADVSDTQSPRVHGAWADEPLSPALLRWRVGDGAWHVALDFRTAMLPASRFSSVYAPETRQNHKGLPGRLCYYLTRTLPASAGRVVEVEASDTAGNRVVVSVAVGV